MDSTKRNVAVFGASRALLFTNKATVIAITGRAGFSLGATLGIPGALLCAAAVSLGRLRLLVVGTLVFGSYNGAGQSHRFAAADASAAPSKGTAVSLVFGGGRVGVLHLAGLIMAGMALRPA
jgi:hypothetical protein